MTDVRRSFPALMRLLAVAVVTQSISPGRVVAAEAIDPKFLEQPYQDAIIRPINERVDGSEMVASGGGVYWQVELSQSDTRYIRFYFDSISSPPGLDYTIRVLSDPAGVRVAAYPAAEFGKAAYFITGMLPAGRLRVQLVSNQKPTGLSFRLVHALWQATPGQLATPQSIVPDWDPVQGLAADSPGRIAAKAVALIHIGPGENTCTGVLVDPEIVATNYHCIELSPAFRNSSETEKPSCADVLIEFDYLVEGTVGKTGPCLAVRADKGLDVALLSINPESVRDASGQPRTPVPRRPATESLPTTVTVIHHPRGLPLRIDPICRLRGSSGTDILHDCATMKGSSGSPVLDEQLRWVGLHYWGPYPASWSIEKVETYVQYNGPRYNQARISTAVIDLLPKK
jgi:Trypsin-like peptidase domain